MNVSLRRMVAMLTEYLAPQWRKALFLGALLVANIGLQLANPQIVRYFIDTARGDGPLRLLTLAALLYIGVAVVTQGVAIIETYVAENVGWLVTNELRTKLAAHCLRMDRAFHSARTPGELIERVDGDVTALANFFSRFVVYVLGNVVLLIGVLVALFTINWRVGLAMGAFAVVATALLVGMRNVAVRHWRAVRQASADFSGFLGERLAGTEDIRSSGATGYVLRRLTEIYRRWLPLEMKAGLAWATTDGVSLLVFTLGNVTALAISASLFTSGAISVGTVYLIFQYTELIRQPLEQIRMQLQDFQKAAASLGRADDLLAVRPTILDGDGAALPGGALAVALDGVTFGYDEGETALDNVSVGLAPGQVLGVLGHTGSGKTTLTRLLLRFHDPDRGAVRLGGHDVRALRLADLRQRVGVVTQEVQLFHASVRDNLTLFSPNVADSAIVQVLDDLGLGQWYRSLPHGMDTELASGGTGLSAGESQLLAFARVFLKDPGLVILDEGSSRLDPATERLIGRATDRLLDGRTGIIIAHRLTTVTRADDILILDGGRISEYGNRQRLAQDVGSRFHELLAISGQLSAEATAPLAKYAAVKV